MTTSNGERHARPDLITGVAAAAGVGVTLAGLTALTWATVHSQARGAARRIEDAAVQAAVAAGALPPGSTVGAAHIKPPDGDGVYGPDGTVSPVRTVAATTAGLALTMLGDSTSVGYGAERADQLPGVLLACRLATELDLPVRLSTHGRVGADSAHLAGQVTVALAQRPELAVIVIGANDITEQVPAHRAAQQLGAAVDRLRAAQVQVVVATCPDFGVIAPIPQPLRLLVTRWSQRLAALQEKAVLAAGGVPIAIGRLVSPEFRGRPDLFYADGFHPSASGYARAVEAMTPDVVEAAHRAIDARSAETDAETDADAG